MKELEQYLENATLQQMNDINYIYDLVTSTKHLINHKMPEFIKASTDYLIKIKKHYNTDLTKKEKGIFKSNLDYVNKCTDYSKRIELEINRDVFNMILDSTLDNRKGMMFLALLTQQYKNCVELYIESETAKINLYNKNIKEFNINNPTKLKDYKILDIKQSDIDNINFTTGQALFSSVINKSNYCKYKTWFEDNKIIINIPLTDKKVEHTRTDNRKSNRHSAIAKKCENWIFNPKYLTFDTITTNYCKFFDTFQSRLTNKDINYYTVDKLTSILPNDVDYLTTLLTKRYELKYTDMDLVKKLKSIPAQINDFIDVVYNKNITHTTADKTGRKHSQLTRMCKLLRSSLLFDKLPLVEFDLKTAQPAMAGKLSYKHFKEFDFDTYFKNKRLKITEMIDLEEEDKCKNITIYNQIKDSELKLKDLEKLYNDIKSTIDEKFQEFESVINNDIYEDIIGYLYKKYNTKYIRADVKMKILPFFFDSTKRQFTKNVEIYEYFEEKFPFIISWLKFIQKSCGYKTSSFMLQSEEAKIIFKELISTLHKYRRDHNFKRPNVILTIHDAIYMDKDSSDIFTPVLNKKLESLGYCSKLDFNKRIYNNFK